jgi:hypothetical protein
MGIVGNAVGQGPFLHALGDLVGDGGIKVGGYLSYSVNSGNKKVFKYLTSFFTLRFKNRSGVRWMAFSRTLPYFI